MIEDGYLLGRRPDEPGWEAYAPLQETERRLTQHGDRIETRLERLAPMKAFDRVVGPAIERRAETLARRRPELAVMLRELLAGPFGESSHWNHDLMPALWCLRRGA